MSAQSAYPTSRHPSYDLVQSMVVATDVLRPRQGAAVDFETVQKSILDRSGWVVASVKVGSTLRGLASQDTVGQLGRRTYLTSTDEARAFWDEINAFSKTLNRVSEASICEHTGCDKAQASNLREELSWAIGRIVDRRILAGELRPDPRVGGITIDVQSVTPTEMDEAVEPVGDKLRAEVRMLLGVTCSGNDRGCRSLLVALTGTRFCELVLAGELRSTIQTVGLHALGVAHVLLDTSAVIAMAETPVRWDEGISCFRQAVTWGHRLFMLTKSVSELRATISVGAAKLEEMVRDESKGRDAFLDSHWVVRAAWYHERVEDMWAEAKQGGTGPLRTVQAFVDWLNAIPSALAKVGVKQIDPEDVPPEDLQRWTSALAASKTSRGLGVGSRVARHDAYLCTTLSTWRRNERPLAIIVTPDTHIEPVYRNSEVGQLRATWDPMSASLFLAELAPAKPVFETSWTKRIKSVSLALGHLTRDPDLALDPAYVHDPRELLVADEGDFDGEHIHCTHTHSLVNNARKGISRATNHLRRIEAERATAVPVALAPVPSPVVPFELTDPRVDDDPVGAQDVADDSPAKLPLGRRIAIRARRSWIALLGQAVLALGWLLSAHPWDHWSFVAVGRTSVVNNTTGSIAASVPLFWAAFGSWRRTKDWRAFVINVGGIAFGVWQIGFPPH